MHVLPGVAIESHELDRCGVVLRFDLPPRREIATQSFAGVNLDFWPTRALCEVGYP
jgi:hypothetical protein